MQRFIHPCLVMCYLFEPGAGLMPRLVKPQMPHRQLSRRERLAALKIQRQFIEISSNPLCQTKDHARVLVRRHALEFLRIYSMPSPTELDLDIAAEHLLLLTSLLECHPLPTTRTALAQMGLVWVVVKELSLERQLSAAPAE